VVEDLGRHCADVVLATVRWGVDQAVHPPPGITHSDWLMVRWQALDTPCPEQTNLWELVAGRKRLSHRILGSATRGPPR
jgi:hypothetical protein